MGASFSPRTDNLHLYSNSWQYRVRSTASGRAPMSRKKLLKTASELEEIVAERFGCSVLCRLPLKAARRTGMLL